MSKPPALPNDAASILKLAASSMFELFSSMSEGMLLVDRDWRHAEGRWFAGAYDEVGIDVHLERLGSDPVVLGVSPPMIRAGAAGQELHLFGANLPARVRFEQQIFLLFAHPALKGVRLPRMLLGYRRGLRPPVRVDGPDQQQSRYAFRKRRLQPAWLLARFLASNIKYAVLIIFVAAAVVTPSGDMMTQAIFAAPMLGLYLLSILIAWFVNPRARSTQV